MTQRKRRKPKQVTAPPKPPGVRRLATPAEACVYAHLSRRTLYRLIDSKRLKAYKLSDRKIFVDLDSIDALLNGLPEREVQAC